MSTNLEFAKYYKSMISLSPTQLILIKPHIYVSLGIKKIVQLRTKKAGLEIILDFFKEAIIIQ